MNHSFGRTRPSKSHGHDLHIDQGQPHRDTHFRPLPPPSGRPPFQLDLAKILSADDLATINDHGKLVFHLNGDMGGIKDDRPQTLVAAGMEGDLEAAPKGNPNRPSFLYILGDCVYFNGEIEEYYNQFYEPYVHYNAPIFAVPGNHDGENLPGKHSLDGFVRNFCAERPGIMQPEAKDSNRTAMVQPNVYWTLLTPLANFVGLYSNVPEGGDIRADQDQWLVSQLKTLPKDRPLFVSLHHPIYSGDNFHSGSTRMKQVLEDAFRKANRIPEMVFAGHVHNYQRFTKMHANGSATPYIVAGAGGYHNLHTMKKVDGEAIIAPVEFERDGDEPITLESYSDDHHGFLRLEVTRTTITGKYYTVPRPHEPYSKPRKLIDYFKFDWKARRVRRNSL
jgi:hypothetical protein